MTERESLYHRVGGQPWFERLIDRFYSRVEHDSVLRPLYPDDLTDSKRFLSHFLAQYWGGPPDYSEERGHPRLRMRHGGFTIRQPERDAWLDAMLSSVGEMGLDEADELAMVDYFEKASTHLINDFG